MGQLTRHLGIVVALALLFGATARAEQPQSSKVQRAKGLFDEGMAALRSGRFAEARDRFRASLAIQRHRATAFNLAVTLRGTGEVLEALRIIDDLLSERYGALTEPRRDEARKMREKVAAEVATLELSASGAPKVVIRVDGIQRGTVESGRSLRLRMDPGPHLVTATARGMITTERKISVRRAAVEKLELALRPEVVHGTLLVESSDPSARIEIVGVTSGAAPLRHEVAPGDYVVRATGERGTARQQVTVLAERRTRVRLTPTRSVLSRPWLWITAGAVVAAGVVTAVVLATRGAAEPISDPVFDTTYTLVRW